MKAWFALLLLGCSDATFTAEALPADEDGGTGAGAQQACGDCGRDDGGAGGSGASASGGAGASLPAGGAGSRAGAGGSGGSPATGGAPVDGGQLTADAAPESGASEASTPPVAVYPVVGTACERVRDSHVCKPLEPGQNGSPSVFYCSNDGLWARKGCTAGSACTADARCQQCDEEGAMVSEEDWLTRALLYSVCSYGMWQGCPPIANAPSDCFGIETAL